MLTLEIKAVKTVVHLGLPILLFMATLWLSPAAAGDHETEALPNQYIYLTEFARLRHEAARGNAEAQFQLGVMHYDPPENSGISQSYRRAYLLFMEAALRGHTVAQHNVGAMYWNGDYTSQDRVEGYAWFMLAAKHGDHAGQRKQQQHLKDLTAEQQEQAQSRLVALQNLLARAQRTKDYDPRHYGVH